LYGNWLGEIANRFQSKFDAIYAVHNFDYGDEFEIALCEVLRTILPGRAAVCRGYVIAQDGRMAGDDIIVFDTTRSPVLRALGNYLSRKEKVPAEAVLAYIEAKHTLSIHGEGGQSLQKATEQTAAVKALPRVPLEHRHMVPGLDLGAQVQGPISFPGIRNPWYTAIWSRRSSWLDGPRVITPDAVGSHIFLKPDVIATDEGCLLPFVVKRMTAESELRMEVRPFLCASTEHVWSDIKNVGLGLAAVHLLWAIEWIILSEIPWPSMISSYLRTSNLICSSHRS
jgi:hypothetical protein